VMDNQAHHLATFPTHIKHTLSISQLSHQKGLFSSHLYHTLPIVILSEAKNLARRAEILRFAQNDMQLPCISLLVNI
jgi:hypothetical protein